MVACCFCCCRNKKKEKHKDPFVVTLPGNRICVLKEHKKRGGGRWVAFLAFAILVGAYQSDGSPMFYNENLILVGVAAQRRLNHRASM